MNSAELNRLIASYKAQGGTITRVAPGTRSMSEKEVYARSHGTDDERSVFQPASEWDEVDERHEVIDHMGRSHFKNGYGEWVG